jgi:hypothetical protein
METLPLELMDDPGNAMFGYTGKPVPCRRRPKWKRYRHSVPKGDRQPVSASDHHPDSSDVGGVGRQVCS